MIMFNAPYIVENIIDIKEIYDINSVQESTISSDVVKVDGNTCVSKSSSEMLSEWEQIIGINNQEGATLDERRSIILSNLIRNSFSLDVLKAKMDALCKGNYTLEMDSTFTNLTVRISSISLFLMNAIYNMLERLIPLNVTLDIQVIYNSYSKLSLKKHSELTTYTHQELREESEL